LQGQRIALGIAVTPPNEPVYTHRVPNHLPPHHRRSIRRKGYDYARPGAYFVTICAQGSECLFGQIVSGQMHMNDVGQMVHEAWHAMPRHYAGIEVDVFVVMPNHVHGIIRLVGAGPRARPGGGQPQGVAPTTPSARPDAGRGVCPRVGQPRGAAPTLALSDVVHRFKSLTTVRFRQGVVEERQPPLAGRLWQRNYFEHIIRNDRDLERVREYVAANPLRWSTDRENPAMDVSANVEDEFPWEW
jgi:putative transposase